ncbi:MAG: site-specific integrase [Sphingobacteriales bacterium]|nr:site-specific integrase [Sphingobacteriales bacterium]
MSVILRKRKNADGSTSLRLDIFHNGRRTIETLKHLKLSKPSNLLDREENKELLKKAEAIRLARTVALEENNYNMESEAGKKTIITEWMQAYIDGYTKKDKRNLQGVLKRFISFLSERKLTGLTFGILTALIIEDFIDFLEAKSTGEGASSYFTRFKKMIKHAYRKRLLKDNVLDLVERKVKGKAKKKDTLTLDELKTLSATSTESSEVRRAFLFSCVTGLRWCDVKALKWQNLNLKNRQMSIVQSKTGEVVTNHLNDTAIKLLGIAGKPINNVFDLPTANGANKTVKAWVKRAKIDKVITWHNARHSFGTNLIYNDVDVLTASQLLGHTSMKHTQRYVKAADEMKQKATEKINIDL